MARSIDWLQSSRGIFSYSKYRRIIIKKLLFTGGGGAGNEAIWRLLNHKYEIHFADADTSRINPIIDIHNRHEIPFANKQNFLSELIKLCKELEINFLIPGVDEELKIIAQSLEKFLPTKLILPSLSFIKTNLNKFSTAEFYSSKNIKVPMTEVLSNASNKIPLPIISKPKKGRGSRNVLMHDNYDDIITLKSNLTDANDYIIQQAIAGEEYTVQMISNQNNLLKAIIPVKLHVKSGITISAVTSNEKNVVKICNKIHNAFPTAGIYNIQLILTNNNEAIPFEINPRISTTFCLALYSLKIDPIELVLNEENYSDNFVDFKQGVRLDRFWYNHFSTY
jgi:carbamoyl-phosphate synthase large subunit